MRLTILGSGTVAAIKDRACASYFLKTPQAKILLDCGPDTLQQLVRGNFNYKDVDAIILSHFHADHSAGIPTFLMALNYTPGFKRKKKLVIAGARGLKKFLRNLVETFVGIEPLPDTYKIETMEMGYKNKLFDFTIETMAAIHSPSSLILKLKYKNKALVYTGDTEYDENLINFAKNCHVFMTECSYPDDRLIGKHLTPSLAGKLAMVINPKKLILTHFYPWVEKEDVLGLVKKYYNGETVLARDFMEVGF